MGDRLRTGLSFAQMIQMNPNPNPVPSSSRQTSTISSPPDSDAAPSQMGMRIPQVISANTFQQEPGCPQIEAAHECRTCETSPSHPQFGETINNGCRETLRDRFIFFYEHGANRKQLPWKVQ